MVYIMHINSYNALDFFHERLLHCTFLHSNMDYWMNYITYVIS